MQIIVLLHSTSSHFLSQSVDSATTVTSCRRLLFCIILFIVNILIGAQHKISLRHCPEITRVCTLISCWFQDAETRKFSSQLVCAKDSSCLSRCKSTTNTIIHKAPHATTHSAQFFYRASHCTSFSKRNSAGLELQILYTDCFIVLPHIVIVALLLFVNTNIVCTLRYR